MKADALNRWSAEAIGWAFHEFEESGERGNKNRTIGVVDLPDDYDGTLAWFRTDDGKMAKWSPATDLVQAWREFVPRLGAMDLRIHVRLYPDPVYNGVAIRSLAQDYDRHYLHGQGDTSDQQTAWALTCAFLEAMESKAYLKAKEETK